MSDTSPSPAARALEALKKSESLAWEVARFYEKRDFTDPFKLTDNEARLGIIIANIGFGAGALTEALERADEEPMEGLSIVCRECGSLQSGEEAGDRVRWVSCSDCGSLRSELAEVTAERDDLKGSLEEWQLDFAALRSEVEKLREDGAAHLNSIVRIRDLSSEVERLRGALLKHGEHLEDCGRYGSGPYSEPCNCGWADICGAALSGEPSEPGEDVAGGHSWSDVERVEIGAGAPRPEPETKVGRPLLTPTPGHACMFCGKEGEHYCDEAPSLRAPGGSGGSEA